MNYFMDFYVVLRYGVMSPIINGLIAALVPVLCENVRIKSARDAAIIAVKIVVAVTVMNALCALFYLIPVFRVKYMSQVVGGLLLLLWLIFVCRYDIVTRITIGLAYFAVICIALVFCFSIMDMAGALELTGMEWFVLSMNVIMMIGCTAFFKIFSLSRLFDVAVMSIGFVCVASVACVVFWLLTNVIDISSAAALVVSTILLVLLLAAYYCTYAVARNVAEVNKRRADHIMRDMQKNMMRYADANAESIRSARHELRNQYSYMRLLLDGGEYDKLKKYFNEYSGKFLPLLSYVDCGNRVISAILNIETEKASNANARIEYDVAVPAEMNFSETDICSLLFNILDNAIEYLDREPETEDRTIVLTVRMVHKMLYVTAKNAVAPEHISAALALETVKEDKALHGYGTKIVGKIADAYGGRVEYVVNEGYFIVSVVISEPDEPSGGGT